MRRAGSRGHIILWVLLVAALAALFTAWAAVVVSGALGVTAADQRRQSAERAAAAGVADAVESLRWGRRQPGHGYTVDAGVLPPQATCEVRIEVGEDGRPAPGTHLQVQAVGRCAGAQVRRTADVTVAPGLLPSGLVAGRDLRLLAGTYVHGCGAYVGRRASGGEHLRFVRHAQAGEATDLLFPAVWPVAGLHAGDAQPDDVLQAVCAPPSPVETAGLHAAAAEAGTALRDGRLHVDELPLSPPLGGTAADGFVVWVTMATAGDTLRLVGRRPPPPLACPVCIVVEGGVCLGDGDEGLDVCGVIASTGDAIVVASSAVRGGLYGRDVLVHASLELEVDEEWVRWPPVGARDVLVTARR